MTILPALSVEKYLAIMRLSDNKEKGIDLGWVQLGSLETQHDK